MFFHLCLILITLRPRSLAYKWQQCCGKSMLIPEKGQDSIFTESIPLCAMRELQQFLVKTRPGLKVELSLTG